MIDMDEDRYEARRQAAKHAITTRWNRVKATRNDTDAFGGIRTDTDEYEAIRNDTDTIRTDTIDTNNQQSSVNNQQSSVNNQQSTINDGERGGRSRASRRFTPPTVDDVRAYCDEHGYGIDPEHFVDYYESNGWRVGKNPMRDWKACVRTWVKNEYSRKGGNTNAVDSGPTTDEDLFAGLTPEQIALYEQYANDGEHYG
jgi:hypothetical protein